jgi:hypothetical protein
LKGTMIEDDDLIALTVVVFVIELLLASILLYSLTNNIQYIIATVTVIIISFATVKITDYFERKYSKN